MYQVCAALYVLHNIKHNAGWRDRINEKWNKRRFDSSIFAFQFFFLLLDTVCMCGSACMCSHSKCRHINTYQNEHRLVRIDSHIWKKNIIINSNSRKIHVYHFDIVFGEIWDQIKMWKMKEVEGEQWASTIIASSSPSYAAYDCDCDCDCDCEWVWVWVEVYFSHFICHLFVWKCHFYHGILLTSAHTHTLRITMR